MGLIDTFTIILRLGLFTFSQPIVECLLTSNWKQLTASTLQSTHRVFKTIIISTEQIFNNSSFLFRNTPDLMKSRPSFYLFNFNKYLERGNFSFSYAHQCVQDFEQVVSDFSPLVVFPSVTLEYILFFIDLWICSLTVAFSVLKFSTFNRGI